MDDTCVFYKETKTSTKLKMFKIKNSRYTANGSLIASCQCILGKVKQKEPSFLKLNVHQSKIYPIEIILLNSTILGI